MKKKILALLLVVAMVCSLALTPALALEADGTQATEATFPDVQGNWAESSIERWVNADVIHGDHDGNFNPDKTITRAELAQVLANLLGLTEQAAAGSFTDVNAGDWFEAVVLQCAAAGIMQGDGAGHANPNSPITRQETIVMVGRALGVNPASQATLDQFQDADTVADWAVAYMAPLAKMGILSGVADADGALNALPNANIDRASTMALLDKAIGQYVTQAGTVKAGSADKFVVVKAAEGTVTVTGATAGVTVTAGNAAAVKLDKVDTDSVKVDAPVDVEVSSGSQVGSLTLNAPAMLNNKGTVIDLALNAPAKVQNGGSISTVANNADGATLDGKKPGKVENAEGVEPLKNSSGSEVKPSGVIIIGGGSGSSGSSGGSVTPVQDMAGKIVILHSNDVHGAIDGYAKMAAVKADYESRGAEVFVMDAGDFIQGTTYVSVSQGETAVELMDMVGYDVVAPGNHEFDYGYANLKTLEEKAQFPILAANVTYNDANAFGDHLVLTTADGVKLGVFGLSTPETASKAHPAKIQGVSFASGQDLYAAAEAEVAALQAEGVDYVICLGHLGIDQETAATANRSIDLLTNVDGIDVFIDGHSHSTLADIEAATNAERTVNGAQLTSTGTKFANVGVVTIDTTAEEKTITTACVSTEDVTVAAGDPIAARAAEIQEEIEAEYGAKFAETAVLLDGNRDPGVRTQETNLGDLIADAILWYATKDGNLEGVDAKNVIAITNGGGIRANVAAGDISKNDVNTVLPFGNTVAVVYVTGNDLLEVLEASTFCTPTAVGAFPQVSGINFTIDTTKEYDQGEQYGTTTYFGPASIKRVSVQSVNGEAFDADATYAIVTNDFLAAGGDTYYALTQSDRITDTGAPMDEAVMAYVTQVLEGVVTAEKYGEPAGRITVKTEADPETVDKTALEAAIDAANTAKTGVETSADGTDVTADKQWVTEAQMTALTDAITTAQGVFDNAAATQTEVDDAVTALNGAVTIFENAKAAGTKTILGETLTITQMAENNALGYKNYLVRVDRTAKVKSGNVTITNADASETYVDFDFDWTDSLETMNATGGVGFEWSLHKLANNGGATGSDEGAVEAESDDANIVPAGNVKVTITVTGEDDQEYVGEYTYEITQEMCDSVKMPAADVIAANLGVVTDATTSPANGQADTYEVTGVTVGQVTKVTIKATGVKKHNNSYGQAGYWVGFGMPNPDKATRTYSVSTDGTNFTVVASAADRYQEVDGKAYNTFYADAENADPFTVVVKEGETVIMTYQVTLEVELATTSA